MTTDKTSKNLKKNRNKVSVVGGQNSNIRDIKTTTKKMSEADKRIQAKRAEVVKSLIRDNDIRYIKTTDENFKAEYNKKGIQPQKINEELINTNNKVRQIETQYENREVIRNKKIYNKKVTDKGLINKNKLIKNRLKVSRLNTAILSVCSTVWISVQLPFAIISLGMFALAAAFAGLTSSVSVAKAEDGAIVSFFKSVTGTIIEIVGSTISFISGLVGFDFSLIEPKNVFLLTYIAILGLAIIQLFTIYLLYKLSNLNPLSGKGAGLKIGTFLLTIIGYSIPLLNILPWFIVWTSAVWLKPK